MYVAGMYVRTTALLTRSAALIGCTEEENAVIMRFHNDSEYMKGTMIRRESEDMP